VACGFWIDVSGCIEHVRHLIITPVSLTETHLNKGFLVGSRIEGGVLAAIRVLVAGHEEVRKECIQGGHTGVPGNQINRRR